MKGKKGYVYRIKLSPNMMQQGYKEYDEIEFETYDLAYNDVIGKWGSDVLNDPLGLVIQKKKPGTDEWEDCR
jgi:hypothetical protein